MGKILDTQNLYRETLNKITNSVENWEAFLDSSSWNFKYDFDDQILIYSQRPDAKACASMGEWNRKLKRWVKKGSNGIFVRDSNENSKFPFKIVFDISDTYNSRRTDYKLWDIKSEYENEIIDTLESIFGKIEFNEKNLVNAIYLSAFNMVEDNIQDYLEIINNNKIGTKLENLESESIETIAKVSAIASVSYIMMTRCGINAREYIELQDISLIEYFDKAPVISAIGNAVSDIAEQGLRAIAKTVLELQKNENIKNRTFEKNKNELYANDEIKERGENEYGKSHLYENRGLQYSEFNNGEGSFTNREIRKNEAEISQGTQQTTIFNIMDGQEVSGTSNRSSRNSISKSVTNSGRNGETGESERGIESSRPNEMGAAYEQFEDNSGGDSSNGNNLRLIEYKEKRFEIPKTEEEQKIEIEKAKDRMVEYKFQQGFIEEFFDEKRYEQQEVSKIDADVSVSSEKNETQTIKSNIKRPKTKIQDFILHPEIPENERVNFKITDNELGVGTPKEKYTRNIEAIKVLKKCENENRYATKEEQEILSQYVGWGGLADVFDKKKAEWSKEYNELKELLNAEEYSEARESTLTAFYTPPIVIKSIYKVLQNMGLKQANILEPSCGVGNFLGMIPKELENCKMYGIEKDNISGRIAQQLYQKSTIAVQGYEKVDLPDSFFDVAVGNVPFGEFKVMDKRYDKYNFLIHDYFFSKTLDKVRPGGIIAFITSKGTMDKQNSQVRRYIAQRANLVGAIRLPSNTFTKNAGTKVTSDILFLQKRENMTDIMPDWVNLDKDKNGIVMNKYFVDNPKMILGEMKMVTTQYGREDSTCRAYEGIELEDLLNEAIEDIKSEIQDFEYGDIEEKEANTLPANPNVKNLSYTLIDGKVYFRENSIMIEQDIPVTTTNRIKGMIELRDTVRNLIELQTEDFPDENIKLAQENLNRQYDNFVKKYGLINSRGNRLAFEDDSSYYLLCSLEVLEVDGKFLRKADMFSKRTIKAYKEITSVDTANEALILSLSEKAKIDFEYMSKLSNKTKEELIDELDGIIYKVPMENEKYETADEYLSGNIREKLKLAESLIETHLEFQKNVDALKQVIPKDLTAMEIGIRIGATWIPTEIIDNFMYELLDTPVLIQRDIKTRFSDYNSQWYITSKNYDYRNVKANKTYGTNRLNAYEIIEKTLNLKDIKIFDTVINADGTKESVFNAKETAIAQAKQEEIKQAFQDWIWKDQERRECLVRLYNDRFNSIRPREYDGSHLNFVGMNPEITLRSHQQNAIAHILYGRNTLLAHEVRSRENI